VVQALDVFYVLAELVFEVSLHFGCRGARGHSFERDPPRWLRCGLDAGRDGFARATAEGRELRYFFADRFGGVNGPSKDEPTACQVLSNVEELAFHWERGGDCSAEGGKSARCRGQVRDEEREL
jgi:hypothetical protein